MNWKLTAALVIVAAIVGVVAYINPFVQEEEREPKSPWFYQVSFDDIISIEVNSGGNTERFLKNDQDAWVFERLDGIPPSHLLFVDSAGLHAVSPELNQVECPILVLGRKLGYQKQDTGKGVSDRYSGNTMDFFQVGPRTWLRSISSIGNNPLHESDIGTQELESSGPKPTI